jgi:DNA-binding NarL/FixJ family response regulator
MSSRPERSNDPNPSAELEAAAVPGARSSEAATEEPRVRVVVGDDHPLIREAIRRRLQATSDIELVGEAASGEEVLELVERAAGNVDVAIIDIHMPPLNGLETIAMLRARDPRIEILILTGRPELIVLLEGMRFGAKGFVLKHRDAQQLTDAIRVVARGEVLIDPELMEPLARFLMRSSGGREALTSSEVDLLELAASGLTNAQIGQALSTSEEEAKKDLLGLLVRLEANQRSDTVADAFRQRLTG